MKLTYFFGNKTTQFDLDSTANLMLSLQEKLNENDNLVCLKQIHCANGVIITTQEQAQKIGIRITEGDFLVTNQVNIALALLTADCLSLFLYDPIQNVIAAVHAGWRGSVAGITTHVVKIMQSEFGSEVKNLQAFFGPCAKVCCYQVRQDFVSQLQHDQLAQKSLQNKNGHSYFDIVLYNTLVLLQTGMLPNNLLFTENNCTICTPFYCSVRKNPGTKKRNVSFVTLK